jgi:DNA-binding NtrC family response regulator
MSSQILLLISDKGTSNILTNLLKTEGYKVTATGDVKNGLDLIGTEKFDLMLASANEMWDPDFSAIKLARVKQPNMRIMAITEAGAGQISAKLTQLGVQSTIGKPLKVDKLLAAVQKSVDFGDMPVAESVNLNLQLETVYPYDNIVSESASMKAVCDMIGRVAATDVSVMISGERGTGKGAIAETIHAHSRRKEGTLVMVDCSSADVERRLFGAGGTTNALNEANRNTLYLRDVGALPIAAQEKLFLILRDHRIPVAGFDAGVPLDARILSSCDSNIEQQIAKGVFKSELYKLLRVILIHVPALRERRQDIMPLVRRVLRKNVGKGGSMPVLTTDVVELLGKYSWPGNIAEIEDIAAHALKLAKKGVISKESLPPEILK